MTFHISFDFALIILIAITGIYLVLGGYFAVTITDFIQGFIMLIGALGMVFVLVKNAGGLLPAIQSIQENYVQHVPVGERPSWLTIASWDLGFTTNGPKILCAKKRRDYKKSCTNYDCFCTRYWCFSLHDGSSFPCIF